MLVFIFSLFSILPNGVDHSPIATVWPDSIKRPARTKVVVDSTGRFLTLKRIFIVGNKITRDRIILRELNYKPGDIVYSGDLASVLEMDRRKLINTRLFNTVELKILELEANTFDLLITVNERWYTFPNIIFALSDRNFNEWWQTYDHKLNRVNYGVRLSQHNMRGLNETLRLTAQLGFTRRFELSYQFPYIDKNQKQGLVIDFDFSEAKNLAYKTKDNTLQYLEADEVLKTTRGGGLTYTYRKSFYESHAFRLEYRNNNIAQSIVDSNANYFGDERHQQQYLTASYGFTSDHRDYIGYPLTGHLFTFAIAKFGFQSSADLNKFETSVTYSRYIPLRHHFYLSNYTAGVWSGPNNLAYANYTALGYRKQLLRGYELYVIEGPTYFINKTTFKKLIFSRKYHWAAMPLEQFRHIPIAIYIKTYADFGYIENYPNYSISNGLGNKFLYSGGFGIDLVGSYDIVMRMEYTFNAEGDRGFFLNFRKEF